MQQPSSKFSDLRGLLSRSGVYAASDILKQAINFLLLPLYTAYLTTADYGTLSIALAAAAVLEPIYGLGQRAAFGRLYFDYRDESDIRDFVGTLATFLAGFGLLLSLILLVVGPILWPLLGLDVEFSPYIVLILLIVPLGSVGLAVVLPLFYVRGQAIQYAAYSLSSFGLATAGTILFVVGLHQGAAGALWGRLVGALILIGPTIWILAKNARLTMRRDLLMPALIFGLPLVPQMLSWWVLNFSDRLILGHFVSLDDVGLYVVGYQFGLVAGVIFSAVGNAWSPWYLRAYTENRTENVPSFLTVYVVLIVSVALGMVVFAREAVMIMTADSYHDAWMIVPIVTAAYLCDGLAGRAADALLLRKRPRMVSLTTVIAAGAAILFDLLTIPHLGIMGAAWGTLFGYALRLALVIGPGIRTGALPVEWGRVIRICALAGLIALPGIFLSTGHLWLDIAWKIGLFAAFPALLWIAVLNARERQMIRAII